MYLKLQREISSRGSFSPELSYRTCRDRRERNVGPRSTCDKFVAYQLGQFMQYTIRNIINRKYREKYLLF